MQRKSKSALNGFAKISLFSNLLFKLNFPYTQFVLTFIVLQKTNLVDYVVVFFYTYNGFRLISQNRVTRRALRSRVIPLQSAIAFNLVVTFSRPGLPLIQFFSKSIHSCQAGVFLPRSFRSRQGLRYATLAGHSLGRRTTTPFSCSWGGLCQAMTKFSEKCSQVRYFLFFRPCRGLMHPEGCIRPSCLYSRVTRRALRSRVIPRQGASAFNLVVTFSWPGLPLIKFFTKSIHSFEAGVFLPWSFRSRQGLCQATLAGHSLGLGTEDNHSIFRYLGWVMSCDDEIIGKMIAGAIFLIFSALPGAHAPGRVHSPFL